MKFLKYLLWTLVAIIILVVIAISVLVYTVNPNDYKGQITQQFKKATGRELSIDGKISWRVFPWLGLSIHNVSLANPQGFEQTNKFFSMKEADVNIKLLPLITGNIELGQIKLVDMKLNLVTNAKGVNNWDDFTSKPEATKPSTPAPKEASKPSNIKKSDFQLSGFSISSVYISNATVSYDNEKAQQKYRLQNFSLEGKNISANSAFPLSMSFQFNSTKPDIYGDISLNGQFALDQSTKTISLSPLSVAAKLFGANFPKNGASITLQTAATLDGQKGTFSINKFVAKLANMSIKGQVNAIDIFKDPTVNGSLDIAKFNPKLFMQTFGLHQPQFANPNALTSFYLESKFIVTPKALSINSLKMGLDDSTLTGHAYLALAEKAQSQVDLNLDKINLGNYMLKATPGAKPSLQQPTKAPAAAPATQQPHDLLPVKELRKLNFIGKFNIGTLSYDKFKMTNVKLNASANNGLIKLAPNSANLYKGQWQSNIAINVQTDTPVWQVNEVVNNVQLQPLFASFYNSKKLQVTGTGDIKTSVMTRGNTVDNLTRNLNGSGKFALTNGTLQGINIGFELDRALAIVNKKPAPASTNSNETKFGSLTGTLQIKNGVVSNNDLLLKSPILKVTGAGTINLVNQTINYRLQSALTQGQVNPKVYELQQKIGGDVPLMISGTLANYKVYPDVQAILKNLATSYVQQQIQKQTGVKVKDLGKQLQKGLQNLFQ